MHLSMLTLCLYYHRLLLLDKQISGTIYWTFLAMNKGLKGLEGVWCSTYTSLDAKFNQ